MARMPGKPTLEQQRKYEAVRAVGPFLQDLAIYFKGKEMRQSQIPPQKIKVWNKRAKRYRYAAGMYRVDGNMKVIKLGGKFCAAPDDAPPQRKKGYKKIPRTPR